jgi:hypothetical protein
MKSMKKIAFAAGLFALAGCGSGPASVMKEVPPELRHVTKVVPPVPDRHPYGDVSKVTVGQWTRYAEGDRTFMLAAVAKEGDDLWIEVIEEGETREASARLVAPGGAVKKAFFLEIAKEGPSEGVPQSLEQSPARPARAPEGSRDTAEEKVKVGDRELAAKRVRVRSEDLDGRIVEEVTWWHPDVPPLYAGTADGGLVRRKSKGASIELVGYGTDAKPLVVIR